MVTTSNHFEYFWSHSVTAHFALDFEKSLKFADVQARASRANMTAFAQHFCLPVLQSNKLSY